MPSASPIKSREKTVVSEAQALLDKRQRITLNNADRDRFLQALASDEGPNEALLQAAQDFMDRYGQSRSNGICRY